MIFRRPFLVFAVAALLALHGWLAVSATTHFCTTGDEIAHVTGGYSYWKFNDYRLQPENGNLPQRWAALPLLAQKLRFHRLQSAEWRHSDVWTTGYYFFYRDGNPVDYMLLCSRAMMALWSVATGLLVFFWSKKLWGAAGGIFSLLLYALSPNFLANGPLATSDVIMVFFFLASAGAWWRQAAELTWRRWLLSAVVFGLACVAKFSAVLLLPIFILLALVRCADGNPLTLGRKRVFTTWRSKLGALAVSTLAQGLVAWAVIWTFYGFRYSAFNPALPAATQFYWPWRVAPGGAVLGAVAELCRHWRLLPEAFLYGFNQVLYFADGRGGFLNGGYSTTGWWWFFPYAFLVKTPLPTLLAFLLSVVLIGRRWRPRPEALRAGLRRAAHDLRRVAPLAALFAVYWAFSLSSELNIGHRHLLPVYPPLFIIAGLLARPGAWRRLRLLLTGALTLWLAAVSFAIRPTYLAYFNPIAGGPDHGYEHLVDSSLDWGQDLPALAAWLQVHRRPGERVFLSYFGTGDPAYYGIQAETLAPYPPFRIMGYVYPLRPGLYCISATMLDDVYSEWRGPWNFPREIRYQQLQREFTVSRKKMDAATLKEFDRARFARLCLYLRVRPPDARINHDFFIFRLSADELRPVLTGNLRELTAAIERAYQRNHPAASGTENQSALTTDSH